MWADYPQGGALSHSDRSLPMEDIPNAILLDQEQQEEDSNPKRNSLEGIFQHKMQQNSMAGSISHR